MSPERKRAVALLREALALLDRDGEALASPHLQYALDLLDEQAPALEPFWELSTRH